MNTWLSKLKCNGNRQYGWMVGGDSIRLYDFIQQQKQ